MEVLTRRSNQILKLLYEEGKATTTYSLVMMQSDLAKQLNISRQALNVHLRKLRNLGLIRTGRGFIDVTERGLNVLRISSTPSFVFLKVSPKARSRVYKKIRELAIERAYRVTGDVDALLLVEREKLDHTLSELSSLDGVEDTKSYVTIESIR